MKRFFSFRNLWRVNAIIILLLGISALIAVILTILQLHRADQYYDESIDQPFASESKNPPIEGAEIGTITAYSLAETNGFFPDNGTKNATFVNMETGRSMRIVERDDQRKIVRWELLQTSGQPDKQAIGYVAMLAREPDFNADSAEVVLGLFSPMKRFTIATKIEAMDSARVYDDDRLTMILWSDDAVASFVSADLVTGKVLRRKPIELAAEGMALK